MAPDSLLSLKVRNAGTFLSASALRPFQGYRNIYDRERDIDLPRPHRLFTRKTKAWKDGFVHRR